MSASTPTRVRPGWLLPLVAALAAGALSLDAGFVFDDIRAVQQSPVVQGEVSWAESLQRDYWGQSLDAPKTSWRPVLPLVWRSLWFIGDGSPAPFHALSLVLHVLFVLGVWRLLERLGLPYAELAAALVAVHPLRAEAVGAIVAQADLASMSAVLFALAAYARPRPRLLTAVALFTLACLCKESAVVYAPLFPLLALLHSRPRKEVLTAAVLFLGLAGALTTFQLGLNRPDTHPLDNLVVLAEGMNRYWVGFFTAGRAVSLAIAPVGLAPHHGYAAVAIDVSTLWPHALLGAATIALSGAAFLHGLRTRRAVWVVLAVLVGAPLLLQTNLVFTSLTDLAERLLLGLVVGFCALVVQLGHVLRPELGRLLGTVTLLTYLALSIPPQRAWVSESALWEHAIDAEPRTVRSQLNRSAIAFRSGDLATYRWHRLVTVWLQGQLPNPVDWSRVEAAEREPIANRWLTGIGMLAPDAPCPLALAWLNQAFRDPAAALAAWEGVRATYGCAPLR